jgi:hypothetical protein
MIKQVPDALLYPVRGFHGLMFVGSVLLYAVAYFVSFIPGGLLTAAGCGAYVYLILHLRNVTMATINGDDTIPPWPDLMDADRLRHSMVNLFFLLLFCIPALVGMLLGLGYPRTAWSVSAIGFVYTPIGLLASLIRDEADALNPLLIARSIAAAPLDYLIVLATLLIPTAIVAIAWIFFSRSLLLAPFVVIPALLYGLLLLARLIGLFYRQNRERLEWE